MTDHVLTIGATLAGTVMAICPDNGRALLNMQWPSAQEMQAVTLERGERFAIAGRLAVVPVRGLLTTNNAMLEKYLGWTTLHGLTETMDQLAANDDVEVIAMMVDSPGGAVLGMQAAVEAIGRAKAVKPVHALVHPMAASAAYWLASQASDITLTPGSLVGSVGVMIETSAPVQPGMSGYQAGIVVSEHAREKRPDVTTEEGRAALKARVDDVEAMMLADIAAGRSIAADELPTRLSRDGDPRNGGGVFWAQDALTRGLVDHLATEAAFFERVTPKAVTAPRRAPSRAYRAQAEAAAALNTI